MRRSSACLATVLVVVVVAVSTIHAQNDATEVHCTVADFRPVIGPCLDGMRPVTWTTSKRECRDASDLLPPTKILACMCLPSDYHPVVTPCVEGVRNVTFVLDHDAANCTRDTVSPEDRFDITCDDAALPVLRSEDHEDPDVSSLLATALTSDTARNASRHLLGISGRGSDWVEHVDPNNGNTYWCHDEIPNNCVWENPGLVPPAQLPECDVSNARISYTRCNGEGKRSLIYYYSAVDKCSGGDTLPPPKHGLPCNIACEPGERLVAGESECTQCGGGYFSIGGGVRYEGFQSMPPAFKTYVIDTLDGDTLPEMPGWQVDTKEGILTSDVTDADAVQSILELPVELVRRGLVSFVFKVDAEKRYDGLVFYVDGEVQMSMVSYQWQYHKLMVPLAPGFHVLQWRYSKDYINKVGADRAYIRSIEIVGSEFNDPECTACPAGTYSDKGASECIPCPADTFSEKPGTETCTPCPAAFYSPQRATECAPRPLCTSEHIMSIYTKCDGSKRVKKHLYLQPKICIDGIDLPPDQEVPCAHCDPGKFRDGSECKYCPEGSFSTKMVAGAGGGTSGCAQCPAMTMAKRVRYYDQAFSPDEVKDEFVTGCDGGYCSANGWRFLGDRMDSGEENGIYSDSWISLPVEIVTPGAVHFNYSVSGYTTFDFGVDGASVRGFQISQPRNGGPAVFSTELPVGKHELMWNLHTQAFSPAYVDPDHHEQRAVIHEITVEGVAVGGATTCTPCPPGHHSDEASSVCKPCPLGTALDMASKTCKLCPPNMFADEPGLISCKACGHGTVSDAGSTSCRMEENCVYKATPDVKFDLSPLSVVDEDYANRITEVNRSMTYFISPCDVGKLNDTCVTRNGEPMAFAYGCQIASDHRAYNIGSRPSFSHDAKNPSGGLEVSFLDGDKCGSHGKGRKTIINFVCDLDAGKGYATMPPGGVETQKCEYRFVWHTMYACPVCGKEDRESTAGPCLPPGKQEVTHYWKEGRQCVGGVLPDTEYIECEVVVMYKNTYKVAVAIAVAVMALLVGLLVCMYIRNKRIYQQYSSLKEQNEADTELEKYTLDDSDTEAY